ncbi:DNA-binding protein HU, partial [Salmonella enterica subsp. enterica serovar Heidelberg]|nr:DNA-binding protein HU [Salmonella enterica subsp. enterica serovar Heidelberg]
MNKSELIMKVAEDADISKAKAEAAVNALINSVTEELKAGGTVALTGFGTFHVKERAA